MLFVPFLFLAVKYALEPGLSDSLSCGALNLSRIFHLWKLGHVIMATPSDSFIENVANIWQIK